MYTSELKEMLYNWIISDATMHHVKLLLHYIFVNLMFIVKNETHFYALGLLVYLTGKMVK